MIHQIAKIFTGEAPRHGTFNAARKMANEGILFDGVFFASEVVNAKRGDAVPTLVSHATGMATLGLMAGITTVIAGPLLESALFFLPGVGPFAALLLATIPNEKLVSATHRAIRTFSEYDKKTRRLQMGGNYEDSESSYNMRMRMITDMNQTLGPARSYLGQEARYLHR